MMSLRTHNVLDYAGGAALVLSPFVFGFADLQPARHLFMLGGFLIIMYSLFTKYEFAAVRSIPLGVHMFLDVLLGLTIFTAPWIFNYRGFLTVGQEWVHYLLAIGLFAVVGLSREKTEADKREHGLYFGPSTT